MVPAIAKIIALWSMRRNTCADTVREQVGNFVAHGALKPRVVCTPLQRVGELLARRLFLNVRPGRWIFVRRVFFAGALVFAFLNRV
jgi:hypothetical protein